jgi:tight adherence protein C
VSAAASALEALAQQLGGLVSAAQGLVTGPQALLVGAGLVAAAAILAGVTAVTAIPSRSEASLARIEGIGGLPHRTRELEPPFGQRVAPAFRWLVSVGRRVVPSGQVEWIKRRLELAGHPEEWDVDRVVALQVISTVLGGALAALLVLVLDLDMLRAGVLIGLGLVAGWLAPLAHVARMASGRSRRIVRELPDLLDLLTISVEAGLSFDSALAYVARNGRGAAAREFARVLQEMQIGTGRTDALRALAERTDVAEVRTLASALIQAETFGVPMARALRIQADEMRVRRRQRIEEQAQRVPVKILFPLIFGILPVLFIVVMGPAALQAFDAFTRS